MLKMHITSHFCTLSGGVGTRNHTTPGQRRRETAPTLVLAMTVSGSNIKSTATEAKITGLYQTEEFLRSKGND